jgi:hypothetical protein
LSLSHGGAPNLVHLLARTTKLLVIFIPKSHGETPGRIRVESCFAEHDQIDIE